MRAVSLPLPIGISLGTPVVRMVGGDQPLREFSVRSWIVHGVHLRFVQGFGNWRSARFRGVRLAERAGMSCSGGRREHPLESVSKRSAGADDIDDSLSANQLIAAAPCLSPSCGRALVRACVRCTMARADRAGWPRRSSRQSSRPGTGSVGAQTAVPIVATAGRRRSSHQRRRRCPSRSMVIRQSQAARKLWPPGRKDGAACGQLMAQPLGRVPDRPADANLPSDMAS